MYDDMPYKYPQIEKMAKDFAELTLAPLWRIVIFHSMGQSLSVATALKSRKPIPEAAMTYKPAHRVVL